MEGYLDAYNPQLSATPTGIFVNRVEVRVVFINILVYHIGLWGKKKRNVLISLKMYFFLLQTVKFSFRQSHFFMCYISNK